MRRKKNKQRKPASRLQYLAVSWLLSDDLKRGSAGLSVEPDNIVQTCYGANCNEPVRSV